MSFSQKLQQYRKTEKLSQEELAHRLGVSRQSVSKWEQNLSFPETEKLIELSSLMGMSLDVLLKEDALPSGKTAASVRRCWLTFLLVVLLTASGITIAALTGRLNALSTALSAQQEKTSAENEAETAVSERGFENEDLQQIQSWFFDFARENRLDYMPHFTQAEGAPVDSEAYLYWAYAVNLDHWGENTGIMSKEYVEETVRQYFRVTPGQHRSHWKSWDFDAETGTYTAWPESLREKPYYLLTGLEVNEDCYTVHATCYSTDYLPSEEDDTRLKTRLLNGENTELSPVSEITVSFYLEYFSFYRPVFLSFEERFLTEPDAGA